jgi:uncharacterized membrane protein YfcA
LDISAFFSYAALGLVAGFFGGLLGIGGGSVTLPLLFFLLKPLIASTGISDSDLMHVVMGTTFAAMVFNAAAAAFFHAKHKHILWKVALILLPSLILGPIAGSYVATSLEGKVLRVSFGIFQLLTAVYFLLPRHKQVEVEEKAYPPFLLNLISFAIGGIGSVLGIGGGIIMVPVLDMMGMQIKKAIGTSSFTSSVMLLVSALSFLVLGLNNPLPIPYHLGYIYLPAFFVIGFFSILAAPLGVNLVRVLPIIPLKRVFALALAILGTILMLE